MKKRGFLLALLALTLSIGLAAVPYDSATVKDRMHHNQADLGKVQASLDAKDFVALQAAFQDFLDTATIIQAMDPPKGDPAAWKAIWADFATAAKKGIDAAKAMDAAKAAEALQSLKGFMGQGHRTFRF